MTVNGYPTKRWYLLGLAVAMPFSCMPVLFKEISADLDLSLVQIGTVWGRLGLAGVFVSLMGGVLGDRYGVKRVLGAAYILGGLAGVSRGMSTGFISLSVTVFAFGIIRAIIPINVHKTMGILFPGRLGTANGVVAMGMGIGLMLGAMLSATVLSPLLGSWRNELFLFGAISIAAGVLWSLPWQMPWADIDRPIRSGAVPMREAVGRLLRVRAIWLGGLVVMLRMGSITGMVGYLPLYLEERGWEVARADGTLAGFYAISTISVIPLSLLSDRLVSRWTLMFLALVTAVFGVGLIPSVDGPVLWALVLAVGMFWDAFMAVAITLVQETKEVGPEYSGTALGLTFTFAQLGSFIAPPLGNNLANISPGLPFLFWTFLSMLALMPLFLLRTPGRLE